MASRKKVLLKVRTIATNLTGDLVLIRDSQVIILGDSGVGKTSLMNQYVRSTPAKSSAFYLQCRRRYKRLIIN